jgi:hypothetical protein
MPKYGAVWSAAENSGTSAATRPRTIATNVATIALDPSRPISMLACWVVYDRPFAAARSRSSTSAGMSEFFAGTTSRLQISMRNVIE